MRKAVYLLAAFHLTLVVGAITHKLDGLVYRGWWEKPLLLYSGFSYSVWRFGFFAPDVGKSTEMVITVHRQDGTSQRYSSLDGFTFFTSNLESANRFYVFKLRNIREQPLRELASRSIAAKMLNMDPDGVAVDVKLGSVRYPTMADFRKGAPVENVELYTTTFSLRSAVRAQ